jgi:hypothetical protein
MGIRSIDHFAQTVDRIPQTASAGNEIASQLRNTPTKQDQVRPSVTATTFARSPRSRRSWMDRQYSMGAKTGADITLTHPLRNRTAKFGCPDGRGGILKNSQTKSTAPIINSTESPAEDWAPTQNAQSAPAATATTIKMPRVHAAPARSHGSKHRIKTASRIPPAIANIMRPGLDDTLPL